MKVVLKRVHSSLNNLPANGAIGLLQSELVYDVLKEYDSLNSV